MFVNYKLLSSSEISNPDHNRLEAAYNPSVPSVTWLVFLRILCRKT